MISIRIENKNCLKSKNSEKTLKKNLRKYLETSEDLSNVSFDDFDVNGFIKDNHIATIQYIENKNELVVNINETNRNKNLKKLRNRLNRNSTNPLEKKYNTIMSFLPKNEMLSKIILPPNEVKENKSQVLMIKSMISKLPMQIKVKKLLIDYYDECLME